MTFHVWPPFAMPEPVKPDIPGALRVLTEMRDEDPRQVHLFDSPHEAACKISGFVYLINDMIHHVAQVLGEEDDVLYRQMCVHVAEALERHERGDE